MALGVGVCITNTKAVIEAIWSAIHKKPSEFVRTPKYGVTGRDRGQVQAQSVFTLKRLALPIIEISFGCYMSVFMFVSMYYAFAPASIPFLLIFAGGYFYVGWSSLSVLWKMHQEAQAQLEEAEALA
jgi:hypothetical protein